MRHPFANQCGSSGGSKELQSFDNDFACLLLTASVQPQNSERQRCIDRSLRLLLGSRPARRTRTAPAASIRACRWGRTIAPDPSRWWSLRHWYRREMRFLSIRSQGSRSKSIAQPASRWECGDRAPGRFPALWGVPVRVSAPPVADTSFFTSASTTRRTTLRSVDHKMQQALVVLTGNRVLGLRQIKGDRAILHHHGVSRPNEKVFDGANQSFGSHIRILSGE